LCGVHCINTLLQGPYMTEWDLAKIAQELDALERNLMASQGVDTQDFIKFAAEESGNVARDGMFSIQVRTRQQADRIRLQNVL
jgi:Ataxin-3